MNAFLILPSRSEKPATHVKDCRVWVGIDGVRFKDYAAIEAFTKNVMSASVDEILVEEGAELVVWPFSKIAQAGTVPYSVRN